MTHCVIFRIPMRKYLFLLFISAQALANSFCEVPFLVHEGEDGQFQGQLAKNLGNGGTARVWRLREGEKTKLVKEYFLPTIRDADLRRSEVWGELAEILNFPFLKVIQGKAVDDKFIEYPDVRGRNLSSVLSLPNLDPKIRTKLTERYARLKTRAADYVEGHFPVGAGKKSSVERVAWSHNEMGGWLGPGYLIMYYQDFKSGKMIDSEIQLKPENVIVDQNLNFNILDPN